MKQITIKIGMLMTLLLTFLNVSAYDFEVDGIYYNMLSMTDFTCEVTSGDVKYEGDIIIPEKVQFNNREIFVIKIGYRAFYGCHSLRTIALPETIETIESGAFRDCVSLNVITIPNSTTEIGSAAFLGCDALTTVILPKSLESIKSNLFNGCSSLTSVNLPESTTYIGESAFKDCTSLVSVAIPSKVRIVENEAFSGCSALANIELNDKLTTIQYGTFNECKSLKSFTIPGKVQQMETYFYERFTDDYDLPPFGFCDNLTEMIILYSDVPFKLGYGKKNDYGNIVFFPLSSETFASLYYSLEPNIKVIKGEDLNIEKFYIDRKLSNELILPNLKEYVMGEHISENQVRLNKSEQLQTITCYAPIPPKINNYFTNSQYISLPVRVPYEYLESYKQADVWKNFWNIQGFDPNQEPSSIIAESINICPDAISEVEGSTVQLTATILPENATNKEVTWSSSDENFATVNENGLVSIVSEGSCTIFAKTTDGSDLTAECIVTGVSGINEIIGDNEKFDVYSVDGRLILKDSSVYEFKKFQRGLYIINGKKVLKSN